MLPEATVNRVRGPAGLYVGALIAVLGGMLLTACAPALPREQAEQEIGDFMLDYLAAQQAGGAYTRAAAQPWANAPDNANLIVWAPPTVPANKDGINYLQSDKPLHVWWLLDTHLTEVSGDRAAAVQAYRDRHMVHAPEGTRPWSWGYTEFGILSLFSGNQQAQVYVGISCGPLCGNGTVYTLQRTPSGTWEIRDSEMKWIS